MMEPKLLTSAKVGGHGGIRFRTLLWKDPKTAISATSPKSARSFWGRPSWLMMASGPGSLSLSRDCVGKIFGVSLHDGNTLLAPATHFLAASGEVHIESFSGGSDGPWVTGDTAPSVDRFSVAGDAEGMVWLHGHGDIWELTLAKEESLDLDPGAWVARASSIQWEPIGLGSLSTDLAAGANWGIYRAQGPGTIWMQSGGVGPARW